MKKIIASVFVLAFVITGISQIVPSTANACGFWSSCDSATNQQQTEQETVTAQINRLEGSTPIPKLENSLERQNISKRLTTFSDPAKISYIYLVSYGKVMAFYTVKGKITSGSKRLTANDRQVNTNWSSPDVVVMSSPELDGTYGNSDPYVYFWTTDGTYVQWNGEYMMADQPLQLTTAPELVRTIK